MKRILFLLFSLIVLSGSCQQISNAEIKSAAIGYDAYTNGQNQQGTLLIGDSMISFSSDDIPGPTPDAGTVYEFDGSDIIEMSTGYLLNSGNPGAHQGDPWPRCGIDYYNSTGRKMVFVDTHDLGSTIYQVSATPGTNWIYSTSYLKDGLYTAMKTKADNALIEIGVAKFKAIIVNLGTNDHTEATTLADVLAAYDQLITYLNADFPGSPIYIIVPSFASTSTTINQRQSDIIYHIRREPSFVTNCKVIYHSLYGLTLGYQTLGNPHMQQAFNNAQGASIAAYLADSESDDDVRRITNQFFTPINSTKKAAWRTAILALKANGCWSRMNYFLGPKADNRENIAMEIIGNVGINNVTGGWTFSGGYAKTSTTAVSGSNTYQHLMYYPSIHTRNGGLNDYLILSKVITNNTTGAITATLFGTNGSAVVKQLGVNTMRYQCNDNTNTDVTLTGTANFQNNTWYAAYRDASTTKNLLRTTTTVNTTSVNSTSLSSGRQSRGCQGIGSNEFIDATHGSIIFAQYSGFDISGCESVIDTLEAAF